MKTREILLEIWHEDMNLITNMLIDRGQIPEKFYGNMAGRWSVCVTDKKKCWFRSSRLPSSLKNLFEIAILRRRREKEQKEIAEFSKKYPHLIK